MPHAAERLTQLLQTETSYSLRVAVLLRLGTALKQTMPDPAFLYADEASRIATDNAMEFEAAMAGLLAAAAAFNIGRLDEGERRLAAAVDASNVIQSDWRMRAYAQFLKALFCSRSGRLAQAMDLFTGLLTATYARELLSLRGQVLNNIANVATQVGMYEEANQFLVNSTLIARLCPSPTGTFWIANNYSTNLCEQCLRLDGAGEHAQSAKLAAEALPLAQEALALVEKINAPKCRAAARDTYAFALLVSGRLDESRLQIEALRRDTDTPQASAILERGTKTLMHILVQQDKNAEAAQEGEFQLSLSGSHGDQRRMRAVAALLAQAYSRMGRWADACRHYAMLLSANADHDVNQARAQLRHLLFGSEPREVQLLGLASHDLLSPLCSTQAVISSATYRTTELELNEAFEKMAEINTHALDFTRKYLAFARLYGDTQIELKPTFIADVLDVACDEIEPLYRAQGVALQRHFHPCEIFVPGNEDMLIRIFVHLLDNALHASCGKGSVAVTISHANSVCTVCVQDNGEGLPLVDLPLAFAGMPAKKFSSPKLGLPFVAKAVGIHGGVVYVDTPTDGSGTSFHVALPSCAHQPPQSLY